MMCTNSPAVCAAAAAADADFFLDGRETCVDEVRHGGDVRCFRGKHVVALVRVFGVCVKPRRRPSRSEL